MKVAILTHRLGYNYGGILQNWALQQVLKDMGHKPVTIDWEMHHFGWLDYIKAVLAVCRRRITGMKLPWPHTPIWQDPNVKGLCKFVQQWINMSQRICLNKVSQFIKKNKFDAAIVGSDQVWRPKYIPQIENMFFPFESGLKPIKIAYGASFGTDDWEFSDIQTKTCARWLKGFKAVSVREQSAIRLCLEKFDYSAVEFVLDPTMLISKERYKELCKDIPTDNDGYILTYCLDSNHELTECAEAISRRLGFPIKVINGLIKSSDTVEYWLATFRDAKYVVTDSYHGTVFSLIFNKPFTTFYNHSRGNARFDTLISLLGVGNRMQSKYNDDAIDWDSIKMKMFDESKKSLSFLETALNV